MSEQNHHLTLANILSDRGGIPAAVTQDFLDAIDAPHDLKAFKWIVDNLEGIIHNLIDINPNRWSFDRVSGSIRVITTCQRLAENDTKLIEQYGLITKGKYLGLRGHVSQYPLYCSLRYPLPNSTFQVQHQLLQAHFINACAQFKEWETENKPYGSSRKTTSLLIRRIALKFRLISFLRLLPLTPLTPQDFANDITSTVDTTELEEFESTSLDTIRLMLDYTIGNKTPYTQNRQSGFGVHSRNIEILDDPHDIREIIDHPDRKLIYNSDLSNKEAYDLYLHGCSGEERLTSTQMVADKRPLIVDKGLSPATQAYRTRARNRSIATANQLLPQRWDRLNLHDVAHLLHGVKDLIKGHFTKLSLNQYDRTQIAAIITVMYWTSSPIDRALKARISRSIKDLPKNIYQGDLFYCLKERVWVIGQIHLEHRRQVEDGWEDKLRPVNNYIIVPCDPRVSSLLWHWLPEVIKRINKNSKPMFPIPQNVRERIKSFLSLVNKQRQTRLTPYRISTHLFNLLADNAGDVGDAAILTGRKLSTGQITALYYYAPKSRRLQEIYQSTCYDIICAVYKTIGRSLPRKSKPRHLDDNAVGSQICPTKQTVSLFSKDLKTALSRAQRDHRNPNYLTEYHNAYTTYCLILIGFTTGYRAVHDPFYSEAEIDWETGFSVICDKDDNQYYNTRLAWLPDICLQQLMQYKQHRYALAERLHSINPELSKMILAQTNTDAWSFSSKHHSSLSFLFYLKENGSSRKVTPEEITKKLKWSNDLPLNTNRHYLRTQLREKGVRGEIIDAFMGHWDLGQEPHGKYSSLSPQAFRDQLDQPLTELLVESGWKTISGFL